MTQVTINAGDPASETLLTWERHFELTGLYSRFYRELCEALAPRLACQLNLPLTAALVFTRGAVVPLAYLYLDRLLRLDLLMAGNPGADWVVRSAPAFVYPSRIERLQQIVANSRSLKQSLLVHQANLWNLKIVDDHPTETDTENPQRITPNRNFNRPNFAQKLLRIVRLARKRLVGSHTPIPILSMGYSSVAFRNAGFYGTDFADVLRKVRLEDGSPNHFLRNELRSHLSTSVAQPLSVFLRATSFSGGKVSDHAVLDNFVNFMVDAFPSSLLEKAWGNLEQGVATLRPYHPAPLIVGETGDLESLVLIAACKVLGMECINFQHGGHIGYLIDQTSTREIEEYICDRFITWGWSRYPEYPPHPEPPVSALPNPWLSERAKLWRSALHRLRGQARTCDFLLFSSRVHRFPTIPSGAYQLTADYLRTYSDSLIELAREARRQQQSILHKPYNHAIAELMTEAMQGMEREGGKYYHCAENLDKGLTEELLAKCLLVLWDQPGTGFLECLASGIPTLCYWPRIYNREEPHASEAFAMLESVGIIHRTARTLFLESKQIKEFGVEVWMSDPARRHAISQFCRLYAWTENNWEDYWTKFLSRYRQ